MTMEKSINVIGKVHLLNDTMSREEIIDFIENIKEIIEVNERYQLRVSLDENGNELDEHKLRYWYYLNGAEEVLEDIIIKIRGDGNIRSELLNRWG